MKTNETLQKDVQEALQWEPLLNAAEIGVTAKDGVITLTGTVNSYAKKLEAEEAAKNVVGVKAVVEKIEIFFGSTWKKSDGEIAIEVLNAFKWNLNVPNDKLKVKVEEGWVTLAGELRWNHEKQGAQNAIRNLLGVKGVTNNITIKSVLNDAIEQKDIESALERNWATNDREIKVTVSGNIVTLTGIVNSWYQKKEAGRMAWNAPGVLSVENDLSVEYDYTLIS